MLVSNSDYIYSVANALYSGIYTYPSEFPELLVLKIIFLSCSKQILEPAVLTTTTDLIFCDGSISFSEAGTIFVRLR